MYPAYKAKKVKKLKIVKLKKFKPKRFWLFAIIRVQPIAQVELFIGNRAFVQGYIYLLQGFFFHEGCDT